MPERTVKMIAVGIDIGKNKHAAAVLDPVGAKLMRPAFYGNDHAGAEKLLADIAGIAPPETTVIGMESTGSYWCPFRDFLAAAGYRVAVINPIVTSASIAGDVRGRKTDKGDSVAIAMAVLRGARASGFPADTGSRELKVLTRQRSFLVRQSSDLKRRLKSTLAEVFPEFETLFDDIFANLPAELLRRYPTAAALAKARRTAVERIVREKSRGKKADDEARRLIAAAKASLAKNCAVAKAVGECVLSTLRCLDGLAAEIGKLESRISACPPPDFAEVFMGIKGAGKLLPKVVASEFGDVSRFVKDPETGRESGMYRRMLAYAGMEPRIRESGKWKGTVHMSKRGSGALRTALMLMSNTVQSHDPFFRAVYEKHKNKGKPHKVALSYVAEKLLQVACARYRDGKHRPYTIEPPAKTEQCEKP